MVCETQLRLMHGVHCERDEERVVYPSSKTIVLSSESLIFSRRFSWDKLIMKHRSQHAGQSELLPLNRSWRVDRQQEPCSGNGA